MFPISVKEIFMHYINRKEVETYGKKSYSKSNLGFDEPYLLDAFNHTIDNTIDHFSESTSYELAQTINYIDHWMKDEKEKPIYENYGIGSILFVDFGAMNFGFELSYPHPSVVLGESDAFLFVIPCSTRKHGKYFPDILDGTKEDGFLSDTGVILDNCRWISKGRVIARMGKVTDEFLRRIFRSTRKYFPLLNQI